MLLSFSEGQYGRIVDIDLKLPPRPPGYCFIEVSNEDAMLERVLSKFTVTSFVMVVGIAVSG